MLSNKDHYLFLVALYVNLFRVLEPTISISSYIHTLPCQHLRGELSKLVSDHILRYPDVVVDFSIVDLEDEADKVWQDCRTARLCLNRRSSFACFRADDRKASSVSVLSYSVVVPVALRKVIS